MDVFQKRRLLWALSIAAVVVWLGPWQGPSGEEVEVTVAAEDDALRLTIYLVAQQIEAYRQETGRLPDSLTQVGDPVESVEYQKDGRSGYTLHGFGDRVSLTYDSDEPLDEFLGDAEELLEPGGGGNAP